MVKVLFICHGNICRSPMAEFVMKDLVRQYELQDQFYIASAATSREELGNPVHPGTTRILNEKGISTDGKRAVQLTQADYNEYDYLIVMDHRNLQNIHRMIPDDVDGKISTLLDYTVRPGDIADPWYTGDFRATYEDVLAGCQGFLQYLSSQGKIH
jgi:protein-tyrosine phosphatase